MLSFLLLMNTKQIFVLTIKYTPIIMMVSFFTNNLIFYFGLSERFSYYLDYFFGNSILFTLLLYICSSTFSLCNWHRLIITANLINLLIAIYDREFHIPIKDLELLILYFIVATIFLFIILFNRFTRRT